MDRIVKVCQILAIIYYLLLISDKVCQATQSQNDTGAIDQLILEIFDVPNGQDGQDPQTSDRGGSGQTDQPVNQYPITQPNVVQPEQNHSEPPIHTETPIPVHPEPDYKPSQPEQPHPPYPTPTGTPTGPYPKPSEVASNTNTENEPNVSENHFFNCN